MSNRLEWLYDRLEWLYDRLEWLYDQLEWLYDRLEWLYDRQPFTWNLSENLPPICNLKSRTWSLASPPYTYDLTPS